MSSSSSFREVAILRIATLLLAALSALLLVNSGGSLFVGDGGAMLEKTTTTTSQSSKGPESSPYVQCRKQLDPSFDERQHTYLHNPQTKNYTMSLHDAFASNATLYFLHQRKAGGSTVRRILFEVYQNLVGKRQAMQHSFVPCIVPERCSLYELPLFEENHVGRIKLVASHMTYHIPFARAPFESQVLITNFREPLSRIKSCMLYRYRDDVHRVFRSPNFTVALGEELFLRQRDIYGTSCLQEPFRILSPFNPDKEPVAKAHIHDVCCHVKSQYHIVRTPLVDSEGAEITQIERDLTYWMHKRHFNHNTENVTSAEQKNLESFLEYMRKVNVFVQSELDLYNCVLGTL